MSLDKVPVDVFAEALSEDPDWYTLGVFLGIPSHTLKEIGRNYRLEGTMRCLIALYESYSESCEEPLSWEIIVSALQRKKNVHLANKLQSKFTVKPEVGSHSLSIADHQNQLSMASGQPSLEPLLVSTSRQNSSSSSSSHVATVSYEAFCDISSEFELLSNKFEALVSKIKNTLKKSEVSLGDIQDLIRRRCGLSCISEDVATFNTVFTRIEEQCSIVNFHLLVTLVENLLSNKVVLKRQLKKFKKSVDYFNASTNMIELVALIKSNKCPSAGETSVKLKVREFWSRFTMKQFEMIINEIFQTLYDYMSHISVTKGCICFSWIVPESIDASSIVPVLPLELIELLGIISLHIGSKAIYNIEGEGCEIIEAAMLQAVELKNTQAIELLVAVGCDPEVALMFNKADHVMTNVVNIRDTDAMDSNSSSGTRHVCVLGHNKHVEAIVNPNDPESSQKDQCCDTCKIKDKMLRQAHQETDHYRQKWEAARDQVDCTLQDPLLMSKEKWDASFKTKQVEAQATALTDAKLEKESPPTIPNKSLEEAEEKWKTQVAGIQNDLLKQIVDNTECEKIPFIETVMDDKMIQTWLVDEHDVEYTGEIIGYGAYSASDLAVFHGTEVVAREPFGELSMSWYFRNRYIRSICLSSVIRHPNIVQFIGATHYDSLNKHVLLYERMDNNLATSLLSIQGGEASSYSHALDAGRDIGSALCYLHSFKPNPIIHRHISFTTVLTNPLPNGKLKYKLSAFEAANIDCYATKDECRNAAEVFIAPEAMGSNRHHSSAMDVYSLGVVLMMVALIPPNCTSSYIKHLLEKNPLVSSDKISYMKEVIQQCLDKVYYHRPTASKLLQELKRMRTQSSTL